MKYFVDDNFFILLLYVDDMLLVGQYAIVIAKLIKCQLYDLLYEEFGCNKDYSWIDDQPGRVGLSYFGCPRRSTSIGYFNVMGWTSRRK